MKKRVQNSEDVTRRAILAHRLARKAHLQRRAAPPKTPGHHDYGLRSPAFMLRSYLFKLKGSKLHGTQRSPFYLFWSALGIFLSIFILARLDHHIFMDQQLLMLGSFGASAVILFGAPHTPYAQPRSILGGQVVSAFVGVSVYFLLGDYHTVAAAASVMLAFVAMQVTGTVHPPGGATALIAASGSPVVRSLGYMYLVFPVGVGILILIILGVIFNNISRNRQYPVSWF